MSRDDEPTAPARQLSSLGVLVVRVETVLDEIGAVKRSIAALEATIAERGGRPSIVSLPAPATVPAPVEQRPSLAVKAAKGTTRVGTVLMIGTGVLSVAGQIIAVWKPEYAGPIIEALRLLASLGGG